MMVLEMMEMYLVPLMGPGWVAQRRQKEPQTENHWVPRMMVHQKGQRSLVSQMAFQREQHWASS